MGSTQDIVDRKYKCYYLTCKRINLNIWKDVPTVSFSSKMCHFAPVHMKGIHMKTVAGAFKDINSSHLLSTYNTPYFLLSAFQILSQIIFIQTHERKY